ncbi:hypothetical protein QUB80_14860 [Chlorogloeopsis sp. ULAP01]|uniref:hypothetical protein n=1 Tax=Chlorogloeopsis sp. ULAP01 TaxID=3056483 RepID=UPI0025AB4B47|nr:hypothetical protein [Chlorogloeopsis sp. ULAP01]MDM9381983.1 hypothetical protein [Chlorogloeopsis sp. ULAP01]
MNKQSKSAVFNTIIGTNLPITAIAIDAIIPNNCNSECVFVAGCWVLVEKPFSCVLMYAVQ